MTNSAQNRFKNPIWWILPIAFMMIFAPWSADVDLMVSSYFYHSGSFDKSLFFRFIYDYGIIPGWIILLSAVLSLIGSLFILRYKKLRTAAVYLILTLAIGSGVIIHGVLKDHWGRPRPKQSIEFGGNQPFRAFYEPHFNQSAEPSKSFPSGHASMGFYFFSLIFLGYHYREKSIFWLGIILTVLLGILLSAARIAQGGHFLSDILFSALIMWLTALFLYQWLLRKQSRLYSDSNEDIG